MTERGNMDLEERIEKLQLQLRVAKEQLEFAAKRIKNLRDINEGHRQLNGNLRVEISDLKKSQSEHEKDKNLLQGYKSVIHDLSTRLRKHES